MPIPTKKPLPVKKALKKVAPAHQPARPTHHYVDYHDAYPRAEGPPPIQAGTSGALFDSQGEFLTLDIDSGAFRLLWELAEAEAKLRFPVRSSMASARAAERAVIALRKAWERRVTS